MKQKFILGILSIMLVGVSLQAQDTTVQQSKITGIVFDYTNGQSNSTPISFEGTVYVALYNPTTERVNYVTTLSGSNYTFTDIAPGTYHFTLSIYRPNVGGYYPEPVLPSGYYLVANPGDVTIIGTETVSNKNFEVTKPPTTDTLVNNYIVWVGYDDVPLSDLPLSGKTWNGTALSAGSDFVITNPPSNFYYLLVYNGIVLNTGDSIKNYNPSLLKLRVPWDLIRNEATVVFYYKMVQSGIASENSASYTINLQVKDPALPVDLVNFTPSIINGKLFVKWQTLSEKNNEKFIVEISKNGISDWSKIGEVKSKAPNGESNGKNDYEFGFSLTEAIGLMTVPALLAMFLTGYKRSKKLIVGTVAAISIAYSCQKATVEKENFNSKIFVRIVQVDKDGKTTISTIKEAVNLKPQF